MDVEKTIIVAIDGDSLEFTVYFPSDFTEDEIIQEAINYVMNHIEIDVY